MNTPIPDFSSARVLVVGDLMLDRYWHGDTSRISPEAPVSIVRIQEIEERPGGAGNVALNLATLGAQVAMLAVVGDDGEAGILEHLLKEKGVDCYFQYLRNMPTITKLRVLSQHQQLIRLDFEKGFKSSHSKQLLSDYKQLLKNTDVVILSDYGKGTLSQIKSFIQLARKTNVPVFIDPKNSDFSLYREATIVTPNLKEFQAVVGHCQNEKEIQTKALALLKKYHLGGLLITRGEYGMSLFQRNEKPIHIPTRAKEVFDVTGAGDTVIATLAASIAVGLSLSEAISLSNAAAGIVVGKLGAATVTPAELRREIHPWYKNSILNEEALTTVIHDAKAHGEKVVMTNGCFDILHAGHIHYLEQAKKLGDRLVIAVNDDDSVRRLKGPARPINALENRMAVLAALSAVDWVVSFSEDTPERLISRISPDILVKGGDWEPHQIAGAKHVLKNGGTVHSLAFVEGQSTSAMLDRITMQKQPKQPKQKKCNRGKKR
jgi:D-beta-D-heptose 7-phosphate kinase/D-beta-D-heptose 1-phosphate adenosyltransferase